MADESIRRDYTAMLEVLSDARAQFETERERLAAGSAMLVRQLQDEIAHLVQNGSFSSKEAVARYAASVSRRLGTAYRSVAAKAIEGIRPLVAAQQSFYKKYDVKFDLQRDFEKLRAIETQAGVEFAGLGKNAAERVKSLLTEGLIRDMPQRTLVNRLLEASTATRSEAALLVRTNEQVYLGAYNREKAKDIGVTKYRYVGKRINATRPFCAAALARRVFTKQEIEVLNRTDWEGKIKGVHVLEQAGGYNCQHQWVFEF